MVQVVDGSGDFRWSGGWCMWWNSEQSEERWMAEAMDQWASEGAMDITSGAIEGVMDVTSDGSWKNPRSDWSGSKLSIRMQAMGQGPSDGSVNNKWLGWWMDQWTIERSMDGSGINRRNDG